MIDRDGSALRIAGPVNLETMGAMLDDARRLMASEVTVATWVRPVD